MMDSKDYEKACKKSKIEKIKNLKTTFYAKNFIRIAIKLLPIVISLLAFLFSILSFTHSKYTEKLSYGVEFNSSRTVNIEIGDTKYETEEVDLVRNTGYIDKTSTIIYAKGKFFNISELPTSDFINEVPFDIWLQPQNTITRVIPQKLPIYFGSNRGGIYTYYFILIHGMDNSKHLHMVSHLISNNELKSNIYSELTILKMRTDFDYLEQAKNDFSELKALLVEQNLL